MVYKLLKEEAKRIIRDSCSSLGYKIDSLELEEPPSDEFGDLSNSIAFNLSKLYKEDPYEIAQKIVKEAKKYKSELIENLEAHKAGYINLRINYSNFVPRALEYFLKNFGKLDLGKGKRVCVEHTSVNPAHPLHIGHVRNLAIGDSLRRILEFAGYKVHVLNYIDDLGLQVADLITGLKFVKLELKNIKFDQACGEVYVKINELYEKDSTLVEKRAQVLKEIERGGSDLAEFSKEITKKVLMSQLETCWRLNTRYDLLNFESHIIEAGLWDKVFQSLKDLNLIKLEEQGKYKGCWIFKGDELEEEEKVLVRSDGTTTYIAKDIPYAFWKLGLIEDPFRYKIYCNQPDGTPLYSTNFNGKLENFGNYDKAITVIDDRQSRLQRIIVQILSKVAGKDMSDRYIHLGYGLVSLSKKTAKTLGIEADRDFIHMSGRRGLFITADEILDRLKRKAYEETKKRNPDSPEEWLNKVSESIAVSSLRYAMVRQDLSKLIVFDMDEILRLEGDTAPYLQYTYARACGIIGKSILDLELHKEALNLDKEEIRLVKQIAKLDLIIEEVVKKLDLKPLAKYTYHLASQFNLFYERYPVLKEKDEKIRAARLALVLAFKKCMEICLHIIGIEPLERI
ncbi:MAG: arginine--tRNA ligase [Nitrososphaerales archaeon]